MKNLFWSSLEEEEHTLRILSDTNTKSMIIFVPSSNFGTNHLFWVYCYISTNEIVAQSLLQA